jgi:hypothetical protein
VVTPEGVAKVLDVGLAMLLASGESGEDGNTLTEETARPLSRPGAGEVGVPRSVYDDCARAWDWSRSGRRQIFVAPFRGAVFIPQSDWILVVDSQTLDRQAAWSADGSALYFHSERDGFRCIGAQRLDPEIKQPSGPPFPVQHFPHSVQPSMTAAILDPGWISISAVPGLIVFSLGEMTGNIWMTTY